MVVVRCCYLAVRANDGKPVEQIEGVLSLPRRLQIVQGTTDCGTDLRHRVFATSNANTNNLTTRLVLRVVLLSERNGGQACKVQDLHYERTGFAKYILLFGCCTIVDAEIKPDLSRPPVVLIV